jgi:biotin carboxyl carrier protein
MKINVKVNNQNYEVEIKDLAARPVIAVIGGETFEVWPERQTGPAQPAFTTPATNPALAAAPSAPAATPVAVPAAGGAGAVLAPIPGVIVTIAVKVGDAVTAGKELCVLEAMKMKNSIKAARPGKVTAVRIAVGELVKKNQVLVEFE